MKRIWLVVLLTLLAALPAPAKEPDGLARLYEAALACDWSDRPGSGMMQECAIGADARLLLCDLDGDGMPEIVHYHPYTERVVLLNDVYSLGDDGQLVLRGFFWGPLWDSSYNQLVSAYRDSETGERVFLMESETYLGSVTNRALFETRLTGEGIVSTGIVCMSELDRMFWNHAPEEDIHQYYVNTSRRPVQPPYDPWALTSAFTEEEATSRAAYEHARQTYLNKLMREDSPLLVYGDWFLSMRGHEPWEEQADGDVREMVRGLFEWYREKKQETDALRRSIGKPLLFYGKGDYDGDDRSEAYLLAGTLAGSRPDSFEGEIWFARDGQLRRMAGPARYAGTGRIVLDEHWAFYAVGRDRGGAVLDDIWTVHEGEPEKSVLSGLGNRFGRYSSSGFGLEVPQDDASTDSPDYSWKRYWFRCESNRLTEYRCKEMTRKEAMDKRLEWHIDRLGGTVTGYLLCENGNLYVNYSYPDALRPGVTRYGNCGDGAYGAFEMWDGNYVPSIVEDWYARGIISAEVRDALASPEFDIASCNPPETDLQ